MDMMMDDKEILSRIAGLDPVVNNSARLMIIYLLNRHQNMDYLGLMDRTGLSSGNLTTHLQKLMQAGYVIQKKSFIRNRPHTSFRITESGMVAYEDWGSRISCALPLSTMNAIKADILRNTYPHWRFVNKLFDADLQTRYSFIHLDKGLNMWPPANWANQ
jgi:DNA-binding HxlR family transcriptional regulator